MSKFKKGDRVVVAEVFKWQEERPYEACVGQVRTITGAPCGDRTVWAATVESLDGMYFSEAQLELEEIYNSPLYRALT